MGIRVCKFGGSSLADANQMRKVQRIIQADPQRCFVVPSAPGKRFADDQKITDLLYLCHEHARQNLGFEDIFIHITERYQQICVDLGLKLDLKAELTNVRDTIVEQAQQGRGPDYAASRGEYLNGLIVASMLEWPMIDPYELFFFKANGQLDQQKTDRVMSEKLADVQRAVVPGFYGQAADGSVRTFSRGGSDVTGALVARGVRAEVYENWTDVSGVLMADPRIVDNPPTLDMITYRELRELAYMGATVLHDEAIFPVRSAGIPVNIRNTNQPGHPGTMIVATRPDLPPPTRVVSGIAGRKDFTVIAIEKAMMNQEIGFARRLLSILESNGISFEHMPSGIDTISLVISDQAIAGKLEAVVEQLRVELKPDAIEVYPDMALVATVGRGMARQSGISARLFASLAKAGVNIRMIDQGSSEMNIIVGVEVSDFENAVRAAYTAFR